MSERCKECGLTRDEHDDPSEFVQPNPPQPYISAEQAKAFQQMKQTLANPPITPKPEGAREFWFLRDKFSNRALVRDGSEKYPDDVNGEPSEKWLHVVERSALTACEAKLANAHNEVERVLRMFNSQTEELQAVRAKVAYLRDDNTKLEQERDAARAEVERLDARYRAKLDQFNALEMLTKERDRLASELSRERDIWHDLHNGLNARNERYAKALERMRDFCMEIEAYRQLAREALRREGT